MQDDERYILAWQDLYEQAKRDGFPDALCQKFADANASSLVIERLRNKMDETETEMAMRRAG